MVSFHSVLVIPHLERNRSIGSLGFDRVDRNAVLESCRLLLKNVIVNHFFPWF